MGAIEDRGQNDVDWNDFLRGHGGDLEDALLGPLADFEREHKPSADLARPAYGEVKNIASKGAVVLFVEPVDDTTEMQYVRVKTEEGNFIEAFVPAVLPEDGLRVTIDGAPGIFYVHAGDNLVHLEEVDVDPVADEDEQARLMEMSRIDTKLVSYNGMTDRHLYGIGLSNEFVMSLIEAWKHVEHDGSPCQETAESYLGRFMQQFISGLRLGGQAE